MGLLSGYRQRRKDDAELGRGVWRRAHDRFRRGLDRYHQILEGVQDEELRAELVPLANALADLLPRVRRVCQTAHLKAPSEGLDVPASRGAYLSGVHRSLSRAGNDLATTAQAAAMAAPGSDGASSVRRRAQAVFENIDDAERQLLREQ